MCDALVAAGPVIAECDFNLPDRARGGTFSMARFAYRCPRLSLSLPGPHANTVTSSGVAACGPPIMGLQIDCSPSIGCVGGASKFNFGPKGSCTLKLKAGVEQSCGMAASPCHNVKIGLTCRDIRDEQDEPIGHMSDWTLWTVVRVTTADPGGDMTVLDLPLELELPTKLANGRLKLRAELVDQFEELVPGSAPGACTNLQLRTVFLNDPSNITFASIGTSTR